MHISFKGSNGPDLISVSEFLSLDYFEGLRARHVEHKHTKSWECIFCIRGNIRVFRNGTYSSVGEKQFILLSPGTSHDVVTDLPSSEFLLCNFVSSSNDLLFPLDGIVMMVDKQSDRSVSGICSEIISFSRMIEESESNRIDVHSALLPAGAEQVMRLQLEQFLIQAIRMRGKATDPNASGIVQFWKTKDYLIDRINDFVAYHYNEHLTVSDIAYYFNYSRSRLSNIYIAATGKSISSVIAEMRIKGALERIDAGETCIRIIAEESGFKTQQYFSKVFASYVGISPREYIKKKQTVCEDSEHI